MTRPEKRVLSVVVPAYNEADSVESFLARVVPILREHADQFEIIFAVDPSRDGTEDAIRRARAAEPSVKLVVFSRRVGQPMATLAGIELASGDAVIVMDIDLQDPPELLPEMLDKWVEGFEVVYAQRRRRAGETWLKRWVSSMGYRFLNRFSSVEIPRDTGDFRLMSRRVVNELLRFREAHGFLRGLVALVGFKQTAVQFDRPPRHAGRGHYNRFVGSLRIALNGVVGFSTALLNVSTVIGFLAAIGAFLFAVAYLCCKLAGVYFPVGNPTIVGLVLFIGGIQLICLGIIGQYLARTYEETKHRPRYIIDTAEGFAPAVLEQSDPWRAVARHASGASKETARAERASGA